MIAAGCWLIVLHIFVVLIVKCNQEPFRNTCNRFMTCIEITYIHQYPAHVSIARIAARKKKKQKFGLKVDAEQKTAHPFYEIFFMVVVRLKLQAKQFGKLRCTDIL